jgi:hypothetical protein
VRLDDPDRFNLDDGARSPMTEYFVLNGLLRTDETAPVAIASKPVASASAFVSSKP